MPKPKNTWLPMIERQAKRIEERRTKSTAELHRMIRDAVAAGHTLQEVGDAAGLTKQRISQIVNAT